MTRLLIATLLIPVLMSLVPAVREWVIEKIADWRAKRRSK